MLSETSRQTIEAALKYNRDRWLWSKQNWQSDEARRTECDREIAAIDAALSELEAMGQGEWEPVPDGVHLGGELLVKHIKDPYTTIAVKAYRDDGTRWVWCGATLPDSWQLMRRVAGAGEEQL